jgi:hypothetical protein
MDQEFSAGFPQALVASAQALPGLGSCRWENGFPLDSRR